MNGPHLEAVLRVRRSKGSRVVAIRGVDITNPQVWPMIEPLLRDGAEPLALDQIAAAGLLEQDLAYSTVDDWFIATGQSLEENLDDAASSLCDRRVEVAESTCGSKVDRPEMAPSIGDQEILLWKDLLVAQRLASALISTDVAGFSSVEDEGTSPAGWSGQRLIWSEMLGSVARTIEPARSDQNPNISGGWKSSLRARASRSGLGPMLRGVRAELDEWRFTWRARELRRNVNGPVLLAVLTRRELDRSRPILADIAQAWDGQVVILPWVTSFGALELSRSLAEFPLLDPPVYFTSSRRAVKRYEGSIVASLDRIDLEGLEVCRRSVVLAFSAIAQDAVLDAERLQWFARAVSMIRPDTIVTTRIDDESRRLIAIAATRTRTVTLPHGVVFIASRAFVTHEPNVVAIAGIQDPAITAKSCLYVREAFHAYEYPQRVRKSEIDLSVNERPRVLVLSCGGPPKPFLRDHEQNLRWIDSSARELHWSHDFIFKPHPGVAETERVFLTEATVAGAMLCASRETDLHELLGASEVVVVSDRRVGGSALVHAVRRELPIVLLGPDWFTGSDENERSVWTRFWSDSALHAHNSAELTQILRRLGDDPGFRSAAVLNSAAASSRLFPTDSHDLRQVLGRP